MWTKHIWKNLLQILVIGWFSHIKNPNDFGQRWSEFKWIEVKPQPFTPNPNHHWPIIIRLSIERLYEFNGWIHLIFGWRVNDDGKVFVGERDCEEDLNPCGQILTSMAKSQLSQWLNVEYSPTIVNLIRVV